MNPSLIHSILANKLTAVAIAAAIGLFVAWLIHSLISTHDKKMRPLLVGSIANISVLALIWAGEFAFQRSGWIPAALAWLPQQFFLPLSIVLVVFALVRKNGLCLGINAIATVFVAGVLMGLHFASTSALASNGGAVRVLTYDVDHWPGGVDTVAQTIKETQPAVFCLQNSTSTVGGHGHPLSELQKALPGYRFVHEGEMTIGSKSDIRELSSRPLSPGSSADPALAAAVDGPRPFTVVDFRLMPCDAGRAFRDPGGYFANFTHDRDDQAKELVAAVKSIHGPVVVCGDFNGPPQVSGSKLLTSKLTDAFEQVGNGYGYTTPAKAPLVRADRILLSKDVTAQTIWNPAVQASTKGPASTHVPVEADVVVAR